jgi:hypothetical protein
MAKTFRAYEPDQLLMLPPALQEWRTRKSAATRRIIRC